jgi:RNA polymerase sigma-70 factor, ECF subfamily
MARKEGKDEPIAMDRLWPSVYDELRGQAARQLRGRGGYTIQPTALVHEAYLRLAALDRTDWRGRTHLLAAGVREIRRALIDHHRGRNRAKRGGGWARRDRLEDLADPTHAARDGREALREALRRLAALDDRQARVVELRFFCGLTVAEVADVLGVSKRTIEEDWRIARAWLLLALREDMDG